MKFFLLEKSFKIEKRDKIFLNFSHCERNQVTVRCGVRQETDIPAQSLKKVHGCIQLRTNILFQEIVLFGEGELIFYRQ